MQLHDLHHTGSRKRRKRIGRGGKKGTYSGRGQKGQKSRAGASIKPGFRGGDTPLWKLFPKLRGASKKLKIKQRGFRLHREKPPTVDVAKLNRHFKDNETVSPQSLREKNLIDSPKRGAKILGGGKLERKLKFEDVKLSASVKKQLK